MSHISQFLEGLLSAQTAHIVNAGVNAAGNEGNPTRAWFEKSAVMRLAVKAAEQACFETSKSKGKVPLEAIATRLSALLLENMSVLPQCPSKTALKRPRGGWDDKKVKELASEICALFESGGFLNQPTERGIPVSLSRRAGLHRKAVIKKQLEPLVAVQFATSDFLHQRENELHGEDLAGQLEEEGWVPYDGDGLSPKLQEQVVAVLTEVNGSPYESPKKRKLLQSLTPLLLDEKRRKRLEAHPEYRKRMQDLEEVMQEEEQEEEQDD